MPPKDKALGPSSDQDVAAFLSTIARTPPPTTGGARGRLIFAMDATASREATWDQACDLQAQMFIETVGLGGLEVQLCHYGGFHQFGSTGWLNRSASLLEHMSAVRCAAGKTQVERVLRHASAQAREQRVHALVFVGDCLEEELDRTADAAGELGLAGVPAFVFQEGYEPYAERGFKQIARLTRGAHCRFDAGSAAQLRDLLSAVAVYAAGGRKALENYGKQRGGAVLAITRQLEARQLETKG